MKTQPLTIVKIGGSVLTKKDSLKPPFFFRQNVVEQLAREFSLYFHAKKERFILVHGAGAFAHLLAKRYHLSNIKKKSQDMLGAGFVHNAVRQLNVRIAEIFLKHHCPVFPLSPASFLQQKQGRIADLYPRPLLSLLNSGFIPLLHGDVVNDKKSCVSICSGDQLIAYLTKTFAVQRVLFLTDVDGIFTSDPQENPHAKMISRLTKKELAPLMRNAKNTARADVTGLMQGKLREISSISCSVRVLNGLVRGNFQNALEGKHIGTLIL